MRRVLPGIRQRGQFVRPVCVGLRKICASEAMMFFEGLHDKIIGEETKQRLPWA
jgi:hypothetical protein